MHKILSLLTIVLLTTACIQTTPPGEPCGYGGTSDSKVECECDGELTAEISTGSTTYFCDGQCGECTCYKQDWSSEEEPTLEEINCEGLTELDWAF